MLDILNLIRLCGFAVFSYIFYEHVIKRVLELVRRVRLIDAIPGPTRNSPVLGNIPVDIVKYIGSEFDQSKDLYYSLLQGLRGYTQIYQKERIFRIWLAWEPWVVLWKPETVETVLSNNFLLSKSSQYDFLHPWLGTGLLTSSGGKWRSRRKLLVPAFHFKILHDFVPVFNEQAAVMVTKLKATAASGQAVDIVPVITACALDIICETIMGVSIGAQHNPNNEYCRAVTKVGECWLERLIQPTYWPDALYYKSSSGKEFAKNLSLLHEFTRKVIRERKMQIVARESRTRIIEAGSNGQELEGDATKERKAFLDLLLDHHLNNGELSEEDMREEVDTFMFEGHDTTAMALSWVIFLLGHHPEIQEKLHPEIDSLFEDLDGSNGHITLDRVKELKYLECVVKEGLRLCPSVPFIGRRTHEDMKLKTNNGDEYTAPAGSIIYVMIYMLHRDPDVWPEPERFNPDRFLPENCSGRNPFAYVPFSAGPRNCIGQRFAISELKIVLAFLLRHYTVKSIDARDKILFNMEMVLRPKVPLNVQLTARKL